MMQASRGVVRTALPLLFIVALAGCRSESGQLPPVFGAVFGAEGARSVPYRVGTIEDPAVKPGDKVIGGAANAPGQCIFRTPENRRFRAACPEGYAGDGSG